MLTIFDLIQTKAESWIVQEMGNNQSVIGGLVKYTREKKKLREPQMKAIEVYLWLKFVGQNQKLSEIVKRGLLFDAEKAKEYEYNANFENNYITQFLNQFAQDNDLPNLQKKLLNDPHGKEHNWENILQELLHNFEYPNFLFSLPMGAGKTYLMACFIYLDLFFANLYKSDKRFAHNFVVFAPSAAKTAILPSLQTIKNFHPEWILPAKEAERLKQIIHIEILDSLSSKRRDKLHGNNPNLEKVNRITQTKDFGLVFITNAEKVVLERIDPKDQIYLDETNAFYNAKKAAEIRRTNELRERMSQIPFLGVVLDEVHHSYGSNGDGEKKLRLAVNILNQHGNVVSVLGMSGTPYIRNVVQVGDATIKLNQIQDVVYNFSLADGIARFLKAPEIKSVNIRESEFLKKALSEFFNDFDFTYKNGTKSKIAFYCPTIKKLNEDILPVIQEWYKKNRKGKDQEIFRFYSGVKKEDKKYELPKENLAIFNNLDKPYSDKRVVLLVAVGTEGWDCKSLTGVVLPRQTTTKNFVLQTTCRCLREVDDSSKEKALIYLEPGNYETLDNELKENYNLSIKDLTLRDEMSVPVRVRKPKLGKLKYKQVIKKFELVCKTERTDYKTSLFSFDFLKIIKAFPYDPTQQTATIGRNGLTGKVSETLKPLVTAEYTFEDFVYDVARGTYGRITEHELFINYEQELKQIYAQIENHIAWISIHPKLLLYDVAKQVANCFADEISYKVDHLTEDTEIELLEWDMNPPAHIPYGSGTFVPSIARNEVQRLRKHPNRLDEDFEETGLDKNDISFNYIPYRMDSDFERNALLDMLQVGELKDLELYYNGYKDDRLQNFFIKTDIGNYTPDFLVLKRQKGKRNGEITKVLILETKARTYYNDEFKRKEKFVKEIFIKHNPQIHYERFIDEDGKNDFRKHLETLKKLLINF
ncbi:MAG: DEAD/DEAH box helicase family protein [Bacteroidota bacterium]|nr:DEAD/DEAH box helicase family protein [Bacteroidota bacterium]